MKHFRHVQVDAPGSGDGTLGHFSDKKKFENGVLSKTLLQQ
jgi:16S rRNA C967 or C1407 C5-methylase (RsmB/RsmF family)